MAGRSEPSGVSGRWSRPAGDPVGALLLPAAVGYSRLHTAVSRTLQRSVQVVAPLLERALTDEEKARLGARLYDVRPTRYTGLWHWEEPWFRRQLPRPPSRILVGGAGFGREAEWLCAAGYHVDAFEPAPRAANECGARLGSRGRCIVGSYQNLADAVLDDADNAFAPFAATRYDAVLLGWGSLTHVLDDAAVRRTLQACAALAPAGPVLISMWVGARLEPGGRGHRLGEWLGRRLAGCRRAEPIAASLRFYPQAGFGRAFHAEELEELAAQAGRRLQWEGAAGEYPHATLIPRHRPSAEA